VKNYYILLYYYTVLSKISKHSNVLCYYILLERLSNQLLFETREKGFRGRERKLTDYDIYPS